MPLPRVVHMLLVLGLVALVGATTITLARTRLPAGPAYEGSPPASRSTTASPVRRTVAPRPEVRAARVLRAWDRRRAEAWETGDVERLAGLYLPDSRAGRRDAVMLRSWLARRVRVTGVRTQLLALEVLAEGPRLLVLRVTDRLAGGRALGDGLRRRLPVDAPTTRTVRLRRVGESWVVGEVSAQTGADDR